MRILDGIDILMKRRIKPSKKRQEENKFDTELYQKEKETKGENFYPDSNSLDFGQDDKIPKERINLMTKELNTMIGRRENYSRRRAYNEDEYVDFINERNRMFNKKIKRAFDPYTLETRQNLERGTAT